MKKILDSFGFRRVLSIFALFHLLSCVYAEKNICIESIHVFADSADVHDNRSITSRDIQKKFDKSKYLSPYFGYTDIPHWFRIVLSNTCSNEEIYVVVNYGSIPDIRIFDDENEQVAGRNVPVDEWPVKARNIVFKLFENHSDTIYLRAQEKSSLVVPIDVKLAEKHQFDTMVENILYGFFFGFIVAMILYNLMLYFSFKDATYLYYVIAMFSGGALASIRAGYSVVYLWPNNALLDDRIYLIFAGLSIAASSRFVSRFHNFSARRKNVDIYLWFVAALAVGMMIGSFFFTFVELTNYGRLLVIIGIPSFLALGIQEWYRGYRPARFFVIAWIPYSLGVVLIVLRGYAVPYSPIIDLSAEYGTLLEAILLSFALADRINEYKKGKVEAEKKALKTQLENRELQVRNQELDYDLDLKNLELQNERQQLATTTLWLTQKNHLLREIRESLARSPESNKEVSKKIALGLDADDDWNKLKGHFEKVHPDFFQSLLEQFPNLTQNEQRLCAYLRMNLSTKEISTLIGISPSSIEQARRRLRKKLGISNTDTNLLIFLQSV